MPATAASRTSPIKHCQVAHTLKTYSPMSLMAISNVHIGNITQNIPLSISSFVYILAFNILHWNMHVASSYYLRIVLWGHFS